MTRDYPYRVSSDRDPDHTRSQILHVLAAAKGPLRRRAIQQQAFGTDLVGAGQTATALVALEAQRLVARWGTDRRKWVCTDAGRHAVALEDALREAS